MEPLIRLLTEEDYPLVKGMVTGLEDDYVVRIFDKLSRDQNRMFGLFMEGRLVSLSGYSIYANRYAMLGRLRSHTAYKGYGYSTQLMKHMLDEVFKQEEIQWVGANTQEHNFPAQRVIEKVGLTPQIALHGAVTDHVNTLHGGNTPWGKVDSLDRKKDWIEKAFIQPERIFPYECYYPFPSSFDLFPDGLLKQWNFYENEEGTRMLITKYDQKKNHYLHTVYPWSDFMKQPGLWETISLDFNQLKEQTGGESTYIWMDMTKQEASTLPDDHSFNLPSPWILYGIDRPKWQSMRIHTGIPSR
ncbi:GNAT family N-acetyltransferase [Virgibacillus sediminis]|uniref:GNAT family N-acetyltransferase n=1 Tax=Virgibacillus sediminis TaxID=202260 RepID=A0ABV7A9N4_9BACI